MKAGREVEMELCAHPKAFQQSCIAGGETASLWYSPRSWHNEFPSKGIRQLRTKLLIYSKVSTNHLFLLVFATHQCDSRVCLLRHFFPPP